MFHFFEIDVAVRGSYWGLLYLDVSWWWIITFFQAMTLPVPHDKMEEVSQKAASVAEFAMLASSSFSLAKRV
jgi:hypothetical protein